MKLILWVAVILTASAGCAAEATGSRSSEVQLIELGLPLEGRVPERVWRRAPAGCEGRLADEDAEQVSWAENAPGLGVVLDADGDVLCVDTLDSIAFEIDRAKGDPSPDPMHPVFLR